MDSLKCLFIIKLIIKHAEKIVLNKKSSWIFLYNRLENKDMKMTEPKKVGIIIATNDIETCWVAMRYASFHLMEHANVNIYFIDSGLKYKNICDDKYDVVKLTENFIRSGGQIYMCDDRENLKACLTDHFVPLLKKKDIISICDDDNFISIMTKEVYLREFKRII